MGGRSLVAALGILAGAMMLGPNAAPALAEEPSAEPQSAPAETVELPISAPPAAADAQGSSETSPPDSEQPGTPTSASNASESATESAAATAAAPASSPEPATGAPETSSGPASASAEPAAPSSEQVDAPPADTSSDPAAPAAAEGAPAPDAEAASPANSATAPEPDTPASEEAAPTDAASAPESEDATPEDATADSAATTEGTAPSDDSTTESGNEQTAAEQAPADPIVAVVRSNLKDPELRKAAHADDLAALESFYDALSGPPLWITGMGYSAKAQAIVNEIAKAEEWGLSAADFDLPPASDLPDTVEAQALDEVKLSLAILKYARQARGGRLTPSRISVLFDQKPELRGPAGVIAAIASASDPAAYLTSLHPKHVQFERLREALHKARASAEARGRKPNGDREVQRLVVNMERWRWMPAELGSYYVWNNVPEFIGRVVKGGKTIYSERIIVGQLKYATPFFSASMRSIVFHPEWVVPETILKEDLQPSLRQGGFLGGPSTAILRQHDLRVSYRGRPVDAETVDWASVNIRQYTFIQPPGPANVLGKLKFNFPNRHAVYMHDTPQRELFAESVRTLSHGCIRVREPDRLAALLLAEDKGWPAAQVKALLAKDTSTTVKLNRPVPVHLTYFTAKVDESGKVETFADYYGLDARMAKALFGNAAGFSAPSVEANTQRTERRRSPGARTHTGGLSVPGLFGN